MHCGEHNIREFGADARLRMEQFWDDTSAYGGSFKWTEGTEYKAYICGRCYAPTLIMTQRGLPSWPLNAKEQVLYPKAVEWPLGYPAAVLEAYQGIIEGMREGPDVFPVRVRKLLEEICDDKGAVGPNLATRTNWLAANGVISTQLKALCDQLRKLGNVAAHDVRTMFTFEDSRVIAAACRLVLDQIYAVEVTSKQLIARMRQLGI